MVHENAELFWNLMEILYGIETPENIDLDGEMPDYKDLCEHYWTKFNKLFEDPKQLQLWSNKLLFAARSWLCDQEATPAEIFAAEAKVLDITGNSLCDYIECSEFCDFEADWWEWEIDKKTLKIFWGLMSALYNIESPTSKCINQLDADAHKFFSREFKVPGNLEVWTSKLLKVARNVTNIYHLKSADVWPAIYALELTCGMFVSDLVNQRKEYRDYRGLLKK